MPGTGGGDAGASRKVPALERLAPWAWVPVPVVLASIGALGLLGWRTPHENVPLLLVSNAVFGTLAAAVVAAVAGRAFVASGAPAALLFGSAGLLMAAAFVLAPVVGRGDPNDIATIHNLGMLASGALQLGGAIAARRRPAALPAPRLLLSLSYVVAVGLVLVTAQLAAQDLTPPFFVLGSGGTPVRQVVVGSAAALLATAGALLVLGRTAPGVFDRLYGSGLLLLSAGLLAILVQHDLGTPIGWTGRIAQYLGGLWMALGAVAEGSRIRRWALPLEGELREERALSERLRDAHEQLAFVLEGSGDGFFHGDLRTGRIDFSERFAAMLGYGVAELPRDIEAWPGMVHPDEREASRSALRSLLRGRGDRYEAERRLRHRDGHWVWTLLRAKVVERDADGKPATMAGTCTDISARKAAEDELRLHVENTPLAVVKWDGDYRVTGFSRRAEEMFGWRAGEVLGKRIDEVPWVPEEDWPLVRAVMAQMDSGTRPENVNRNRNLRKDGTVIHCEWFNSSAYDADGRLSSVFSLVQDVTARETATAALQASEDRFRALAEDAPVGIYETDAEGGIVYLNAVAQRMLGQTLDEARGLGALPAIHPDDRERVRRSWLEAVAARRPYHSEHRFVPPGRPVVSVQVFASPVRSRTGTGTGYVGVMMDVTESRRMHDQMVVTSRLTSLGTLVAGLAHELNNPLAAEVAGQGLALEVARSARQQLATGAPIDVAANLRELDLVIEALEDAQEGGLRVAGIVRDLAAFARPDSTRSPVRLGDVVAHALRWVPKDLGDRADVEVEDQGTPLVLASAGQLAQVALNLVTNAIRATAPGRRGKVAVRLGSGTAGQAVLEVADQGTGIAPAVIGRIFEPFFTTRPAGEGRGAGLGLAVCHSIVTAHGGTIRVDSTPGQGATFRVELPAVVAGLDATPAS